MPSEASPGGTEGVDSGWPGGSSNIGEVLNPGFETPAPYSTRDLSDDVPRVDVVLEFTCDKCGRAGHYRLERLITECGADVKIPDWIEDFR